MSLRFTVPGEPVGKMRARTFVRHRRDGTPFVTTMTPEKTRAYESLVKHHAARAVAAARWLFGPKDRFVLLVRVFRTHEGAGSDLDNVVKAISDALNGIAFADDRYIRGLVGTLARDRESPRVEVEVRRMRAGERVGRR